MKDGHTETIQWLGESRTKEIPIVVTPIVIVDGVV